MLEQRPAEVGSNSRILTYKPLDVWTRNETSRTSIRSDLVLYMYVIAQ